MRLARWCTCLSVALAACSMPELVDVPSTRVFDTSSCCTETNAAVYLRFDCDRDYAALPYTRGGDATYVNASGRIDYAGPNEARCESAYATTGTRPLGLLIERASTNLILNSSAFGASSWSSGSASLALDNDAAVAPDGSFTAERLRDTGSQAPARRTQRVAWSGEGTWTCSVFVKSDTSASAELECERYTAGASTLSRTTWLDLASGAIQVSDPDVEAGALRLADGWWRLWLTFSDTSTTADELALSVYPVPRGTTSTTGNTYVWGAQIEPEPIVTSYIPTTGAPAVRAVDVVGISVASAWVPRAVTIACNGAPRYGPRPHSPLRALTSFDEDPMASGIILGVAEGNTVTGAFVRAVDPPRYDVLTIDEGVQDWDDGERRTLAVTVNGEPADLRLAIDGGVIPEGAGLEGRALPAVTTMRLGTAGLGAAAWDGHVRACALWSFSVSDDELARLSSSFVP